MWAGAGSRGCAIARPRETAGGSDRGLAVSPSPAPRLPPHRGDELVEVGGVRAGLGEVEPGLAVGAEQQYEADPGEGQRRHRGAQVGSERVYQHPTPGASAS